MKRLWIFFVLVVLPSFVVLSWIGTAHLPGSAADCRSRGDSRSAVIIGEWGDPSRPKRVAIVGRDGSRLDLGHGSYVALTGRADWLHREAVFILNRWANDEFGTDYNQLDGERQAQLSGRLAS